MKKFINRAKRILFLLKEKGFIYTYNYLHLYFFYGTKNPWIIKFVQWLEPYPSYIEIEVTTRCNLRCKICERTYWKEEDIDMTYEQFMKIMSQFPKLKWIGLTGIGESFMHKDFLKMLKYCKSKNIYIELYDNFYFIDENKAKELIEMGVDKIFISLDVATKETYENIRVGSDFDRVTNNMRNLIRLKKEMKKYFPEVAFHCIINKLNIHEIPQYIELAAFLSQGEQANIQITRLLHKFKEINDLFVEIPEDMIKKAEEKAKELEVKLTWNSDVSLTKPDISNCTAWLMPFIFATGHVISCCNGNEAGRRNFQKAGSLGNVFEKDFKDIWNGEKYRNLRRMIREGNVPVQCNDCAAFETKNIKK